MVTIFQDLNACKEYYQHLKINNNKKKKYVFAKPDQPFYLKQENDMY